MALQDLTPQLRTRLSRMERAVGWFILLATGLLLFAFGYYVYNTAERKGWLKRKIAYQTSISSGEGLKAGDPVKLMGFAVGEITSIDPNAPGEWYNITVHFYVKEPYFGYIWSDSVAKVSGGLLESRYLEITKGKYGAPTILENSNKTVVLGVLRWKHVEARKKDFIKQFSTAEELAGAIARDAADHQNIYYTNLHKSSTYWLEPDDAPSLTDRAEKVVSQVENALPGILAMTNQINAILANTAQLTYNLNASSEDLRPVVSNLTLISGNLKDPNGSLGPRLLPTNINQNLDATLRNTSLAVSNADTNLILLAASLQKSLDSLAGITSNLNHQVQVNTNILSSISEIVVHTDELIQGLKHHWLLRSAFKEPNTNAPAVTPGQRFSSPKTIGQGP
jgi:ABC-type transporter Mla subunit MlaD